VLATLACKLFGGTVRRGKGKKRGKKRRAAKKRETIADGDKEGKKNLLSAAPKRNKIRGKEKRENFPATPSP